MQHFGFRANKEIAIWLNEQPNRSQVIREALCLFMSRQFTKNKPQDTHNCPKRATHRITPRRSVLKRRGFIRRKQRGYRLAKASLCRARGKYDQEET